MPSPNANSIIVLDFETTGLSPLQGDRAIEIGAVKITNGVVVDSFQELMNPGRPVSTFIAEYTGITNAMLRNAAPCEEVMARFADFIGDENLLAHNASFDQKFLDAEFSRINHNYAGEFACTLLTSRRIYQDAPNHKLGTLVNYKDLAEDGTFHRALFDAEMTAKLWLTMLDDIRDNYQINNVEFSLIKRLAKTSKANVNKFFASFS
ncbi:3'-5' exonuclease [Thalassotalea nanhaiensis]|uniref:DNA-directed DNA polymerase n=1 Tax=Thalassotalea nanhaiensis TaxID=3065648 RepID=A0ABY9TGL8_9GAMM|nr:3'-5' exonuclease [Colwelliaceae bacterium SQ345]